MVILYAAGSQSQENNLNYKCVIMELIRVKKLPNQSHERKVKTSSAAKKTMYNLK